MSIKKIHQLNITEMKRLLKDIRVFPRKKNKKSYNMQMNDINTSRKVKNVLLSKEKNITKQERTLNYNKYCVRNKTRLK